MRKLISIILQFAICSCSVSHSGIYYSVCSLQGKTAAVVHLKDSNEFEYIFAYGFSPTKGKWTASNDTLFFSSKEFTALRDSLAPKIKFNYNDTIDKFIFRGNKLFPIVSKGKVDKTCYLKKQ